jgi:hypothetical protein
VFDKILGFSFAALTHPKRLALETARSETCAEHRQLSIA